MAKRKMIKINEEKCTGCGKCVLACAEGAIEIRSGKAKVVSEVFCDGLGACIGECPEGALIIEEREAPDFDEEAVKKHLSEKKDEAIPLACPSSAMRRIPVPKSESKGERPSAQLSNWPVQLRLAHPSAPYFKNASLLLAADCTAFAYAAMHSDFIKGKATLIGCPKLDDVSASINKLAEILTLNSIKDITLVHVEVPCCSGLDHVVKRAMEKSGKSVPVETVVISTDGTVLRRSIAGCA
jgi:ferredoxin